MSNDNELYDSSIVMNALIESVLDNVDVNDEEFNENNSDAKRRLAYVSVISNLEPIEGADLIECATVEKRNVVVKKGEFEIGDECVYIESDTILPELEVFEFMRARNFKLKIAKKKG